MDVIFYKAKLCIVNFNIPTVDPKLFSQTAGDDDAQLHADHSLRVRQVRPVFSFADSDPYFLSEY